MEAVAVWWIGAEAPDAGLLEEVRWHVGHALDVRAAVLLDAASGLLGDDDRGVECHEVARAIQLAGHSMAGAGMRDWVHMATFALALAGAVYVILDIEYARVGFIRVDAFDQVFVDLRQSMN